MPSASAGHLAHDVWDGAVVVARLAATDEPRVLGKSARIKVQRLPKLVTERAYATQILERHRLAAAGVVGDGDHHQRHAISFCLQERTQRRQVHVAFERVLGGRLAAVGDHQIECARAGVFDVCAGGVEMRVVGDDHAGAGNRAEQDPLRRPALMGRDDVGKRKQLLHRRDKRKPGRRAGVALIPVLDCRPLIAGHRAGAGVGQQIDQHILGAEIEQVVAGLRQGFLALGRSCQPQGLDRVDPKRLDDGAELHNVMLVPLVPPVVRRYALQHGGAGRIAAS